MVVENSIERLIASFSNGKYSHAFLVETNNIEKCLKDIKKFIKVINCPNNYKDNCNANCNLCNLIDIDNLPSVITIVPDGNSIKKNQLLEVQKKFSTKPVFTKFNTYIVCNSELMTESSANSILKFLEEPEENIIGFFITINKESILETIKSRCEIIKNYYEEVSNDNDNFYTDIAYEYIFKIFTKRNLLINKDFILPLGFNRIKYESLFNKMVQIYIIRLKENYFPGNNLDDSLNISNNLAIKQLKIIERTLQGISANGNIELLLDKFVIEMRKTHD